MFKDSGLLEVLLRPLRLIHIIIALILAISAPVYSYFEFRGAVRTQFVEQDLKNEKQFVKKEDFKEVKETLQKINEAVIRVEEQLKHLPKDNH